LRTGYRRRDEQERRQQESTRAVHGSAFNVQGSCSAFRFTVRSSGFSVPLDRAAFVNRLQYEPERRTWNSEPQNWNPEHEL
jgi:hypothetical protein